MLQKKYAKTTLIYKWHSGHEAFPKRLNAGDD